MDMTYTQNVSNGLPDPQTDAEFYEGVPMRRLMAWVIDAVIIVAISVIAVLVASVLTLGIALFFTGFLFMATSFIYRVGFISAKSATPGMLAMGIEFRTMAGQKFDTKDALIHTGLYTVAVISFFGQILSMITMSATEYGRGLPDFVLGSTAINRPLQ